MAKKFRGGNGGRLRELKAVDQKLRTGQLNRELLEGIQGRIRRREPLSLTESLSCLLARNSAFAGEKRSMESRGRGRILTIDVAGNIVTPDDPVFKDLLLTAATRMKGRGMLLNVGHVHCGAVNAAIDFESGKYNPETEDIRYVVEHVEGKNERENSMRQVQIASDLITKELDVIPQAAALYFDWETKDLEVLGYQADHNVDDEGVVPVMTHAARSWSNYIQSTRMEMAPQYAHAIVISDPTTIMGNTEVEAVVVRCADAREIILASGDSFSDPRTLFDAGPQELFLVSLRNGLIPQAGLGSIEYALLHVMGTLHIVIVDTNEEVAVNTRDLLVDSSEIVLNKIRSEDLEITLLKYDPKAGTANIIFE